jgi:hypothetical protein
VGLRRLAIPKLVGCSTSLAPEKDSGKMVCVTQILPDVFGNEVRFTEERRAHVYQHPEMRNLIGQVADVLAEPDVVLESRSDPSALLFYRSLPQERMGVKWLCVVVKYAADDAFVLTAYLTDRPRKGTEKWPNK